MKKQQTRSRLGQRATNSHTIGRVCFDAGSAQLLIELGAAMMMNDTTLALCAVNDINRVLMQFASAASKGTRALSIILIKSHKDKFRAIHSGP